MKFLKFRKESNNFLLDVIFGQALGVGVNYVTSVSASEHIDQLKGQLVWLNSGLDIIVSYEVFWKR